jgi:hypothetical protein
MICSLRLRHSFFILFILLVDTVYAQQIEQGFPEINKAEQSIYIPYRIIDPEKKFKLYDIDLYYSLDSGASYIGPLKEVKGNVGSLLLAGDKVMEWKYTQEEPPFLSDFANFKLVTKYEPLRVGGPLNALYSLVLPGLGNVKVKNTKPAWRWALTTLTCFGLIGMGYAFDNLAQESYKNYTNSTSGQEAKILFSQAEQQKIGSNAFYFAAGAVWTVDIAKVILKGIRNKKLREDIWEKNHKKDFEMDFSDPYVKKVSK